MRQTERKGLKGNKTQNFKLPNFPSLTGSEIFPSLSKEGSKKGYEINYNRKENLKAPSFIFKGRWQNSGGILTEGSIKS